MRFFSLTRNHTNECFFQGSVFFTIPAHLPQRNTLQSVSSGHKMLEIYQTWQRVVIQVKPHTEVVTSSMENSRVANRTCHPWPTSKSLQLALWKSVESEKYEQKEEQGTKWRKQLKCSCFLLKNVLNTNKTKNTNSWETLSISDRDKQCHCLQSSEKPGHCSAPDFCYGCNRTCLGLSLCVVQFLERLAWYWSCWTFPSLSFRQLQTTGCLVVALVWVQIWFSDQSNNFKVL